MSARAIAVVAIAAFLAACGGSSGSNVPAPLPSTTPAALAVRISADTFTDPLGQHDTEVEPSAAVHERTIVAAFQVARQRIAGGSAIGVAASFDGGSTWSSTTLPGITRITGGIADSASDAAVAYDAAHGVWLIAVIPVIAGVVPYPEVSRSTDAIVWNQPVRISTGDKADDKEWIACDNSPSSPYFGHCYVTWDDSGRNGLVEMSTSTDGGATWSAAITSSDAVTGIGAQPAPQPNGNVVVVSDDYNEASVFAITSRDGGSTLGASTAIATIVDHVQAGHLRSGALVTTALDANGTVYAVWQDCRFEPGCAADDLLLSATPDGHAWTTPVRVPLDAVGSGIDHFIPSVGADRNGGRLGLSYYDYPSAACAASCILSFSYATSPDGGRTWSAPVSPGSLMFPAWLAVTNEGFMVADYVASVFAAGEPVSIYTQANAPNGTLLNEATYAWTPNVVLAQTMRRAVAARPVVLQAAHKRQRFIPAR